MVGIKKAIIVQNEEIDFSVTLRNPFHFALELDSLVLR
jgi:hypothetical protein